jgi:hypothetical protein
VSYGCPDPEKPLSSDCSWAGGCPGKLLAYLSDCPKALANFMVSKSNTTGKTKGVGNGQLDI